MRARMRSKRGYHLRTRRCSRLQCGRAGWRVTATGEARGVVHSAMTISPSLSHARRFFGATIGRYANRTRRRAGSGLDGPASRSQPKKATECAAMAAITASIDHRYGVRLQPCAEEPSTNLVLSTELRRTEAVFGMIAGRGTSTRRIRRPLTKIKPSTFTVTFDAKELFQTWVERDQTIVSSQRWRANDAA